MNHEIRTLTGLRGFAALWVALFHFQYADHVIGLNLGAFVNRGYLAVDAFFLLSGLILAHVYGPLFDGEKPWNWAAQRRFLFARFARVYPMHLVVLLAFFALAGVSHLLGNALSGPERYTIKGAYESLLLLHGLGFSDSLVWNDPSWSISAEAFAYTFLFWPCMWLVRRVPGAGILALIALLWGGVLVFAWGQPHGSLDLTWDFGVARIFPEFLAGVWLHRVLAARPLSPEAATACVVAGLGGLVGISALPLMWEALVLPLLCLWLAGLYHGSHSVQAVFGNRIMVWLGRVSYSLYLVHILVRFVAGQALKMAGVTTLSPAMQAGWVGVLLGVSIIVAAAGYYCIEEPARQWLRRRFLRQPSESLRTQESVFSSTS
jgi:peptidoglycan/LPS O-acetylase OafA/YrhL